MTDHRAAHSPTLRSLSKRQWIKICAGVAVVAAVITGGVATSNFYVDQHKDAAPQVTAVSASDAQAASRGTSREALTGSTSYVKVVINGKSQNIYGTNFTDVKSVLDAADITLDPEDTVSPSLKTKVDENTVIKIDRAGAQLETTDQKVPFNTIRKEDPNLEEGQEKVETEGQDGILECSNLVQKAGNKVLSSYAFTTKLKKAPVDKVVLVGTKKANQHANNDNKASTPSTDIGTTTPIGEMQQWAHDYLLANGYSEADFTATVYIIGRESGWSVTATNPSSGAYGLPQSYPGNKMASHGADWQTNYQTQLRWFWDYCKDRYGSIQGAYQFWLANHHY
ncbi:G5 domain-containing protein [Bifidobacterium dolichotidis]|uniref:G5 domain-containing protein n=1 Tax=Bifidobacterium dolichotidis TaxID=2306976 RepID=A0A430FRN2_9BIFI|nr:G5 domain-containing protein [Bifidobacterium dolichotidis]RSX55536.1 G5 domain-containing protein [Bifidobacterium dolichotidis]